MHAAPFHLPEWQKTLRICKPSQNSEAEIAFHSKRHKFREIAYLQKTHTILANDQPLLKSLCYGLHTFKQKQIHAWTKLVKENTTNVRGDCNSWEERTKTLKWRHHLTQ